MGLLDLLGIDLPILQAPMAGVSTPAMAAAVSNAGGLGALGLGATNADGARKMLDETRALTARSIHLNVFCHAHPKRNREREGAWIDRLRPDFDRYEAKAPEALDEIYGSFLDDDAMLALFVAAKPKVVSFHFGVPTPDRIAALKRAGVVLLGSATNVLEGKLLEAAGVDAVIAQGYEAGGHRGVFDEDADDDRLGTLALTRLLVTSLGVPVIGAGGIMDGAAVDAVLRVGASAASLGTAFVPCPESLADAGYRRVLASEAAHHTVMTRAISGRPARCLPNRFTAIGAASRDEEVPPYPVAYDAGKRLHAAAKAKGEFGYGAQWAGQGAPLARSLPAAALVKAIAAEMKR